MMRAFIGIVTILTVLVGGVMIFAKDKPAPQTAIDGTSDAIASSDKKDEVADQALLLGDARHSLGSSNAKVTLVEFSDFQCPYCKITTETLKKVTDHYGDKIRFVFRHYPLKSHPLAQMAAEATEAASAQGADKFWEMYYKIFENQKSLTEASFAQFANEIGLDVERFKSEMKQEKYASLAQKDLKDGEALQVSGTPTLYLNGREIKASSYEDIVAQIEAELNK
ncbi:MAG TPA: thioredoxin domain-containing protein [bacterium]|nr:thioredoxin domain-containing protein [bacterium]HPL55952.1 thioredoxin domain-containing protein [bacterium]